MFDVVVKTVVSQTVIKGLFFFHKQPRLLVCVWARTIAVLDFSAWHLFERMHVTQQHRTELCIVNESKSKHEWKSTLKPLFSSTEFLVFPIIARYSQHIEPRSTLAKKPIFCLAFPPFLPHFLQFLMLWQFTTCNLNLSLLGSRGTGPLSPCWIHPAAHCVWRVHTPLSWRWAKGSICSQKTTEKTAEPISCRMLVSCSTADL